MNLKLTKPENATVPASYDVDRNRSEQPSDTNLEQILSLDWWKEKAHRIQQEYIQRRTCRRAAKAQKHLFHINANGPYDSQTYVDELTNTAFQDKVLNFYTLQPYILENEKILSLILQNRLIKDKNSTGSPTGTSPNAIAPFSPWALPPQCMCAFQEVYLVFRQMPYSTCQDWIQQGMRQ